MVPPRHPTRIQLLRLRDPGAAAAERIGPGRRRRRLLAHAGQRSGREPDPGHQVGAYPRQRLRRARHAQRSGILRPGAEPEGAGDDDAGADVQPRRDAARPSRSRRPCPRLPGLLGSGRRPPRGPVLRARSVVPGRYRRPGGPHRQRGDVGLHPVADRPEGRGRPQRRRVPAGPHLGHQDRAGGGARRRSPGPYSHRPVPRRGCPGDRRRAAPAQQGFTPDGARRRLRAQLRPAHGTARRRGAPRPRSHPEDPGADPPRARRRMPRHPAGRGPHPGDARRAAARRPSPAP